jgi:hypothetical protein
VITLDKPTVDTDIEHLDFPTEDVACTLAEPSHSDPAVARWRWELSCGHGGLICDNHADLIAKLNQMPTALGVGVAWCTKGGIKHASFTTTLERIKG